MQDSVRDAFAVALKRLGYSLNSTDSTELQEAADSLKEQKAPGSGLCGRSGP